MNKKTAIILGVVILFLTSIITPIIIRKIQSKSLPVNEAEIVDNTQEDTNEIQNTPVEIEELSSGEDVSNEEQTGSGEKVEEEKSDNKSSEIQRNEVATKIKTTNKTQANSNEGTANQTQPVETETNNVSTNVEQTSVAVPNAVVIDVATSEETIQVVEEQQTLAEENISVIQDEQTPVTLPDGAVGVLKIDKLGINQKVADGHSLEVLKTNLGHVDSTAYATGNIGILGHNSGNAGYFKNLWDLKQDDVIEYTTTNGTRTYKVSEVVQIADDDWSKLANTTDNRITLITCVKNVPSMRWCIQGIEI